MKKTFLTILTTVLGTTSFSQTTILTPEYDVALGYHDYFGTENTNYNSVVQNAAYTIPGASGGLNSNRAIIKFDLSSIPQGTSISGAKLNLYALGPIGSLSGHSGSNNNAQLLRITENWSYSYVTWNNQPNYTMENFVALPASSSPLQDYTNIDVTALVEDMIATGNFGFLLKLENEITSNVLLFASVENGDSTKFPTLEITFRDASLEEKEIGNIDISIFPNPSSGETKINFHNPNNEENTVVVYNNTGKVVFEQGSIFSNESILDLSELNQGVYFVKVTNESNQNFGIKKLIVK